MAREAHVSAGMLLYRRRNGRLEVFLAHPGGPFWKQKDIAAWTLPKGIVDPGEEPLAAARREFEEETGIKPREPFIPLGSVRQKAGKTVHAWAWEGDADPACIVSNTTSMEFPKRSGRFITFPEVDRCAWFDPDTARIRMIAAQAEFVGRLEQVLRARGGTDS